MNSNKIDEQIIQFRMKEQNKAHLIVHKNDGMNDYLLEITITKVDKRIIPKPPDFILILDTSGSMKNYVHNLVTNIIPRGLNLLNYQDTDIIHLITFKGNAKSKLLEMTVGQLKNDESIEGSGGTSMSGVYNLVKEVLNKNKDKFNYRILVLSDGMIEDQKETQNQAGIFKEYIDQKDYCISVGSIRYGSDNSQEADVRAIASVLMINTDNKKKRELIDVSSSELNENVSQKIYELFRDDYFDSDYYIKSKKIKFRIDPWGHWSNKLKLNEGKNWIYSDKNPTLENVGIYEGNRLLYTKDDFQNGCSFNLSIYNELLGYKIEAILKKVKINKTSGSKAALEENNRIFSSMKSLENQLKTTENHILISDKVNYIIETDISKYDNNQLAQFIKIDNDMKSITEYLNQKFELDKQKETNIDEFTKKVFNDVFKIDGGFDKFFNS